MEQVSVTNSPTVCEKNVPSEVNQMTSNVSVSSFPKLSCRIKNGLVNGITEEKCTSSSNHSNSSSNADDNQYRTQNCVDSLSPENSLNINHKSIVSSETNQIVSMDPSNTNDKGKHKKKTKSYAVELNLSTSLCNKELVSETIQKSESIANCTNETVSNEGVELDMQKLTLSDLKAVDTPNLPENLEDYDEVIYVQYESELQMPLIMKIIQKDLSEPYSIYTYRYFIHNWPKLCFLAMCDDKCVGAIVCKLDYHRKSTKRGYIAMLAVDQNYRKRKIGSTLVTMAIREMIAGDADEVVLETEVTNKPALRLYELLGFVRDKRLFRYYLNGVDALRLKLWLR